MFGRGFNSLRLHPLNYFVSWCNGSTTDSGPVCQGSNPCETTKHPKISLSKWLGFLSCFSIDHIYFAKRQRVNFFVRRIRHFHWCLLIPFGKRFDRLLVFTLFLSKKAPTIMNPPIVTLYNGSDHLGIILIRDEYQKVIKRKEQEPFASILWLLCYRWDWMQLTYLYIPM